MKKIKLILLCIIMLTPIEVSAKRGCCSHHGGVSGCSSSGRQVCNDGTLSPSCTCTPNYIYGCTDKNASNYNSNANKNDGSCIYYGCTDKTAKNYNQNANRDDGSCIYYIYGCTDKTAKNYNPLANKDDGTCEYYVLGCKNSLADNYNPEAEVDDGSCILQTSKNVDDDYDSEDKTDNNNLLNTILGIGVISGGVYLYKRKHQ